MDTPDIKSRLSTGQRLLNVLNKLSAVPGGRFIFSRIIAHKIPYSATTGAKVVVLKPGYAKLVMKDKNRIRNHLNSIHAVALTNFGELTSGLALNTSLSPDVRAIVTQICTNYIKKARGTLMAECRCEPPTVTEDMEYTVEAVIKDQQQDTVATVKAVWRLGLNKTSM